MSLADSSKSKQVLFRWACILFLSCTLWILVSCGESKPREVLIGIKESDVVSLRNRSNLDPFDTGIDSLDALNREWGVESMIPVYPDVSADDEQAVKYGLAGVFKLVVPGDTKIEDLIKAYEADPHIEYAEVNSPVKVAD